MNTQIHGNQAHLNGDAPAFGRSLVSGCFAAQKAASKSAA